MCTRGEENSPTGLTSPSSAERRGRTILESELVMEAWLERFEVPREGGQGASALSLPSATFTMGAESSEGGAATCGAARLSRNFSRDPVEVLPKESLSIMKVRGSHGGSTFA